MAKPLSPPPTFSFPGPSNYLSQRSTSSEERPQRQRRRNSRSPKKAATLAPSSAILSLLATIASSSSVDASPTPPPFLCPSLECADSRDLPNSQRAPQRRSPQPSDTPLPRWPRYVPDKFVRGTDGIWRRVPSYTLYGATVPSGCSGPSCRKPTNVVSNVDDQIFVPPDSNTTQNTTSPIDLPPGWGGQSKLTASRTTLIVALSLSLAVLICIFIIGCLFWRKSSTPKDKFRDVEAKARRSRRRREMNSLERRSVEAEKEAKMVQKVWARATARWKENVRYAARQRRGKRMSTRLLQAQQSSLSLDDSRGRTTGALSRQSSRRAPSPSLSIDEQTPLGPQSSTPNPEPNAAEPALAATPGQPPAYRQRTLIPPIVISSHDISVASPTSGHSTPYSLSRHPSRASLLSSIPQSLHSSQQAELHPPTAHVATDDKAVLARLADFASAPPEGDSVHPADGTQPEISVPIWEDEHLDDFVPEPENSCAPLEDTPPSMAFPAPPSKERLAAAERLEYTFTYDELDDMEPEPGPSAPPFEEASVPPIDENLLPSAPPLLEDEDSVEESPDSLPQPTAPLWESLEQDAINQDGEEEPGRDLNRTASSNMGSSTVPASSPISADLINNSTATRRGATTPPLEAPSSLSDNSSPLPLYRP